MNFATIQEEKTTAFNNEDIKSNNDIPIKNQKLVGKRKKKYKNENIDNSSSNPKTVKVLINKYNDNIKDKKENKKRENIVINKELDKKNKKIKKKKSKKLLVHHL